MDDITFVAAANNAMWCDAVSRSHGLLTEFSDEYWLQAEAPLPLYPNLVSLRADPSGQLQAVQDLANQPRLVSCGVKDSFNCLSLDLLGFQVLFRAEWFARQAAPLPTGRDAGRVTTEDELRRWETAWGQCPVDWPFGDRVFRDSLLNDSTVAFLSCEDDGRISSGAIANLGFGVAGISNWFGPTEDGRLVGCLQLISDLWPGITVVGYGGAAELRVLEGLGFACVGPCRIWTR